MIIKNFIKAARLRTLPLSISGIILGGFLAMSDGLFNGVIFSLALITTIGFQVISNFANDYGDGVKGTDAIRIGEERMVSSGKISPMQMKKAIMISVILTIIFALFLIYESFGLSNFGYSVLFFILGIVSVVAAIKYTVGNLAYGYSGFGDVFVFLFFGLLSVLGSYFLFTKEIYFLLALPAISIGLLSTAVLNLNNMRDYQNDKISAYQTLFTCMLTISKLGAPIAPFYMDRLYLDLIQHTGKEAFKSVNLADFPKANTVMIDKALESKMALAQMISSLVLSLRATEKIKVRQPLQKIMIPVASAEQKEEILAISDLIKHEVNIKEIELLEDASDILVKQIKPNFKVLGPRFGKDMRFVATAVQNLDADAIKEIEKQGHLEVEINGKFSTLELSDVEITSQDIEGWLVANQGAVTVALDVTITESLREEGIARELVNRIQNLRKDSGFELTDHIDVFLVHETSMHKAIQTNLDYIKVETLTHTLHEVNQLDEGIEIDFDDISTKLFIKKHN